MLIGCVDAGVPVNANETARLEKDRISSLEIQAIDGNLEAAHRLTLHYMYAELDPLKVEKWVGYELKNGNKDARLSLGSLLAREDNFYPVTKESCERGRSYLESAKREGSRAATEILNDLSPICTKPWLNPYAERTTTNQ